jgi:hypothetical protein
MVCILQHLLYCESVAHGEPGRRAWGASCWGSMAGAGHHPLPVPASPPLTSSPDAVENCGRIASVSVFVPLALTCHNYYIARPVGQGEPQRVPQHHAEGSIAGNSIIPLASPASPLLTIVAPKSLAAHRPALTEVIMSRSTSIALLVVAGFSAQRRRPR